MSRLIKDLGEYVEAKPTQWPGWAPLALLPPAALVCAAETPRWVLMGCLAGGIYVGCKWLTWWIDGREIPATPAHHLGYLLLWPGMDPREFLCQKATPPQPRKTEWFIAAAKTLLGAVLVWGVVRMIPVKYDLLAGWIGLLGLAFLAHFGSFHLLALFWQRAGVNARPVMRAPLRATSVAELWNRRWNVAFTQWAQRFVFQPMARDATVATASLTVFLVSGLFHDLVISVPAGADYGLPTAYFLLQGCAVLFERSSIGRRIGLRHGWRGWAFTALVTAGPVFLLFHPSFIRNVILPMLAAIGATGKPL